MLSDAFLGRLDALALRMRRPAAGGSGGLRRSKALGSSVEFSDFREYVPGDDVRRIDWNAFARFDRLFLKLFMDEKEQQVNLLVDASASMGFGKWEAACQLAEALGYLCLRGGDRVQVFALGQEGRHTRSLQGRQSYGQLTDFLAGIKPEGRLSGESLSSLPLPGGKGLCLLISDLLWEDGYQRPLQSLLFRKQEVGVMQLFSQQEWEPELEDVLELADSETGERLMMNADYETLKRYREMVRNYVGEIGAFCRAHAITHSFWIPQSPFEEQMLRELSQGGWLA